MDPSTFTVENLEHMILQFYRNHDKAQHELAHNFITSAQSSPAAWSFVWELLNTNKPVEVQFFAASTLQMKLLKYWVEVPQEQWSALRERLLSSIFVASFGPKNVLNRLCIAMAVFMTRIIGEGSTTAISELTQQLVSPHNNVPPDRAKVILLQILTMLAEESGLVAAPLSQRTVVKQEIRRCALEVLSLIEQELPIEGKKCEMSAGRLNQALLCYMAWQTQTDSLTNWQSFVSRLIHIVQVFAVSHEDTELVTLALDALRGLAVGPNTQKMPNTILQIINRSLVLMDIVDREMSSQCPDMALVGAVLRFIVEVGESHTRVILDALLQPDTAQTAICVIQRVLQCTSSPGQYPTEEQSSSYTFSFWYLLQDDLISSGERLYELKPIVAPFYLSLVDVLLYKSMFPEKSYVDEHWDSDTHTMFRCYRQDITDTMLYCYSVLQDTLLERLSQHLDNAVTALRSDTTQWRTLEAVIHSYYAVAEVVSLTENEHVPRFLSCLEHLPLSSLDVRVATTALQAIGAYAEWLNQHPEGIVHVIQLVAIGLQCEEAAPCATMTLKDLTRDCQSTLNQHSSTILDAAKTALTSRRLRSNENVRLMYSVGKILSNYPRSAIIAYLNEVLLPFVFELKGLSESKPDAGNCANILVRLKMVSSLFSSLDTKAVSRNSSDNGGAGDPNEGQPIVLILVTILPMLKNIATVWASDDSVIEALSSILKQASSTLLDECGPLLPDLVDILLSSYRVHLQPSMIDTARQLIIMFGRDTQRVPIIRSFLGELVCRTMTANDELEKAEENGDLLKSFFLMLAQIMKKNSTLLLTSDGVNMENIFQWGSMCMLVREALTAKAATNFMTQLVLTSGELPGVPTIINQYGPQLLQMLLVHIGEIPTNRLEPISDLILALNKKYCEQLSQWLTQLLSQEGFPSARPTKQEKENFARFILRERVSKRKVENCLFEFTLVCRGVNGQTSAVGTAL